MVGSCLAHYQVLELLGRGGMGEVYSAEDTRLRRKVALKVLPAAMAAEPERRRRFEREAQAIAALNHPGIVTIYSVEHEGGVSFLTMELVEGRTLADVVPEGGMPLAQFLKIAVPLADAVHAAHEKGILHRDLKPGNVMVTPEGRVKVLDFGLAKLARDSALVMPAGPHTTSDGQIIGTLFYMAPEQAEGKPVDRRADIFALGVMMYELAVGLRPFAGETNVSVLTSLLRDTPRPLTEIRHDLPPVLSDILQRCMEKDPARRYSTAAELRADLEALGGQNVLKAPAPPWAYAASAAVLVLATSALWWALTSPAHPEAAVRPPASTAPAVRVLITGRKVAILDFENRTGDPELSAFGRLASEAIATSLMAQGLSVVSATEASAGDGITVAGYYTLKAGELRFDSRLISASRGSVVHHVTPVSAPRAALQMAAQSTQRYVVDAILKTLDASKAR
jgi:predicted Ser/Thr protein kinase